MFIVPIYDGREPFSLAKYWSKKYVGDVEPGSTVCVLFSIKEGNAPREAHSFDISKSMKAVYLNTLAIIVLAEPSDDFLPNLTPDPEHVHGVDRLPRLYEAESECGNTDESVGKGKAVEEII